MLSLNQENLIRESQKVHERLQTGLKQDPQIEIPRNREKRNQYPQFNNMDRCTEYLG